MSIATKIFVLVNILIVNYNTIISSSLLLLEVRMAKASNVWKLIVLSVVISLVVLAVFTAVFITMIVPAYNITREQVYSVLSRALPILIGLVLVEIGLLIGKKGEPEHNDPIDKLTPNSYDSWLYSRPVDDPMPNGAMDSDAAFAMNQGQAATIKEVIKEVPVEVIKEVIKEVPVETAASTQTIIKEVEKPIEIKVPVEIIKEIQVPVEVIKEVPVEVIREVIKEVPVEVIKEVVKEVPIEIEKEVVKEALSISASEKVLYDFHSALEEELAVAYEENYPISVVGFGNDDQIETKIARTLGADTLFFTENGITFAILPFYNNEDAELATRLIGNKKIAMQYGRKQTAETMIKQASRGLA